MASTGLSPIGDTHYPRMQIVTSEEILAGAKFERPNRVVGRSEMSRPLMTEQGG